MQFATFIAVFSVFLACAFAVEYPTPTPVPFNGYSYAQITKVIGQSDFNSDTDDFEGCNQFTIESPTILRVIPAGHFSGAFTPGGLLAYDNDCDRIMFWANPIATTNASAAFIFGSTSLGDDNEGSIDQLNDITYDNTSIYYVDDEDGYTFASSSFQSGNFMTTYTTQWGNPDTDVAWEVLDDVLGVVYDPHTRQIFVTDDDCERIVYWPSNPTTAQAPTGVYGLDGIDDCEGDEDGGCDDESSYTCLTDVAYITVDCNGGLWISDDGGIYWFASGSATSTFGISAPDNSNDDSHSDDFDSDELVAISFDNQNTCSYLAVVGYSTLYLVKVTYSGTTPSCVPFCIVYDVDETDEPSANITSIDEIGGFAWDTVNPGFVYVSDGENDRIVYFNGIGTNPPVTTCGNQATNSAAPVGTTPTAAASNTASLSFGASPSNTNTPSASLSFGASPSNTPFFDSGNGAGDGFNSAGSALASWLF